MIRIKHKIHYCTLFPIFLILCHSRIFYAGIQTPCTWIPDLSRRSLLLDIKEYRDGNDILSKNNIFKKVYGSVFVVCHFVTDLIFLVNAGSMPINLS